MTSPSIRELLEALDETIAVPPEVDARLRQAVGAALRGDDTHDVPQPQGETVARFSPHDHSEVIDMTTTLDPSVEMQAPRGRWRLAAGALAVAAAGLGIALIATSGGDDATTGDEAAAVAESPARPADDPTVIDQPRLNEFFDLDQAETFDVDDQGINPYRIVVAEDFVWLASLDGTVTKRRVDSLEIVSRISIPDSSLLAFGHGSLWVADAVSGDVLRLDPTTDAEIARIPTGVRTETSAWRNGGLGMLAGEQRAFSRIGSIAVGADAIWVGDQDGRVLRIDPTRNTIDAEVPVAIDADRVHVDVRYLLVADRDQGVVVAIDHATGAEVDRFGPADGPLVNTTLADGVAYVQDPSSGTVTRIDLATGDERTSAPLGPSPRVDGTPLYPAELVIGEAGLLAVTRDAIHLLDPDTMESLATRAQDSRAGEMTIDERGDAWLVRFFGSEVDRFASPDR